MSAKKWKTTVEHTIATSLEGAYHQESSSHNVGPSTFSQQEREEGTFLDDKRLRKSRSFRSVVQEVINLIRMQNYVYPVLEPLIRRVVKEEVDTALRKYIIGAKRNYAKDTHLPEPMTLKFLSIHGSDLKSWTLDNTSCFPVLETLVLFDLWDLNEIPLCIGEIPSLQLIRLEECTPSVAISAMKIKEEQEIFGNDSLLIHVMMSTQSEIRFREMVEMEGLSINNIHLELY